MLGGRAHTFFSVAMFGNSSALPPLSRIVCPRRTSLGSVVGMQHEEDIFGSDEDLPSQLDLDPSQETGVGAFEQDSVAGDLFSLSAGISEVWAADVAANLDAIGENAPPASASEQPPDGEPSGLGPSAPSVQASVFSRRGRPDKALQEAMRRAMADAPSGGGAGSPGEFAQGQAPIVPSRNIAVEDCARKRRKELVEEARIRDLRTEAALGRPIKGVVLVPPVANAVLAAAHLGGLPGERLDAEVVDASPQILGSSPMPVGSKRLRATSLGMPEAKLNSVEELLASALALFERGGRAAMEKQVAQCVGKEGLLMYIDAVAYDETPLPVAVKREWLETPKEQPAPARPADAMCVASPPGPIACLGPQSSPAGKLSTTQGLQKVLSMVQTGVLLFKLGNLVYAIMPCMVTPLALLQRGTATVMKDTLLRLSTVSLASTWFPQRSRAVCTDRASANLLAETMISDERGAEWKTIHILCEAHKVATSHEMTFGLADANVKGMIHCALSLRDGANMTIFRTCLKEEVASRFVVKHGSPPASAVEHKKRIMRLFVSHGSQLAMRRMVLALCPNGDWRNPAVEYYLPAGAQHSRQELIDHVASGLVAALCGSQPVLYKRSRWTGADLATDCFGILEACHGLLSSTYQRFIAKMQARSVTKAKTLVAGAAEGDIADEPAHAEEAGAGPADAGESDAPAAASALVAAAPIEDGGPVDPRAVKDLDWAVINASHRRKAARWLASRPLDWLILQRTVMEPLRQYQVRTFLYASEEWEKTQRGKIAEKLSHGPAAFSDREHRLAIAAQGKCDDTFFEQLQLLFEREELWEQVPTSSYSTKFKALAFRMVSRAGCAVYELLALPHRAFPFQIFRLLAEPEAAETLLAVPDCLLDQWSLEMKRLHPTFAGEVFLSKLAVLSQVLWKDISQLEARHATIRRLLLAASLQTHTQAFEDLSAQWLFLQFRKRLQKLTASQEGQGARKLKVSQRWPISGA